MNEPFTFDLFLALPRLSAMKLSPGGTRLVVAVGRPGPDGKKVKTALWQVDPAGVAKARRITQSAAGESVGCFLHDGSLLFAPDAGVDAVAAARDADQIVFGTSLHPDAANLADDADRAKARKEAGIEALLIDEYPIRHWDEWLAPRRCRLFAAPAATQLAGGADDAAPADAEPAPRDLTGDAGPAALVESAIDIAPDGKTG